MKREEYSTMYEVEDTHWWYLGHRRLYASLLNRYCPRESRGRVLDTGCGTGGTTQWFRETFEPRYLEGIEISEEALALCRERGLHDVRCCSLDDLPFPDGSFDLVICLNVLYHRQVASDLEALLEIKRVMAPGGYLLLNLPALAFLGGRHDLAVGGVRRYRAGGLENLLTEAGLDAVSITYFNLLLLPVMVVYRMISGRRDDADVHSDLWLPPAPINRALRALLAMESKLALRYGLPLGSSLTALARL